MATNKHAIIRYEALDRCFSNKGRKFFIDDLIEYVSTTIANYSGISATISRRQIFKDINFMKSESGFNAPISSISEGKRVYYRYNDRSYSISMQQINPIEAKLLKNAIEVLSRFKGIPQFEFIPELSLKLKKTFQLEVLENYILFDHNEYLKNLTYLGELISAIQNKQVLLITYKAFNQKKEEIFEIHPYFLKQYNKRWFLFGQRDKYDNWSNLALDRIIAFELLNDNIYKSSSQNPEEYFEDLIGVTRPRNVLSQIIEIKIDRQLWPYIDSKPMHPSQKVLKKSENYIIIQLDIVPNYEFYSQVLGFGAAMEIIKPIDIRMTLKNKLENNLLKYT